MDKPLTYWDTFTTSYQMGSQKHRVYLLDLFKEKGVETLLDVGCGTGPIWEMIVNTVTDEVGRWDNIKKYKGVDYSPAMIEIANQEFPAAHFEVQDARKLSEWDNTWDCVLLMHSLDHLDDYQSAIAEAARVAKKYVCIVLWRSFVNGRYNNLNDRNMYGKQEGENPWEDTHLQEYSRELLEEEFVKNGLTVIQTAQGDDINEEGKYNFLFLLQK